MGARWFLVGAWRLLGCGASSGDGTGDASTTPTGTDGPSTGTGSTLPTTSGASGTSSTAGTSGTGDASDAGTGEATTGSPVDICDPDVAPIPEEDFAARMAATICAQKTSCGCEVEFACETALQDQFAAVISSGQSLSFAYDGVCAASKLLGLVERHGCKLASEIVPGPDCSFFCPMYVGSLGKGEACNVLPPPPEVSFLFLQACADGNVCNPYTATCAPPFPVVGAGEACQDEQMMRIANCGVGYCDFQEGTCLPVAMEGEPCEGRPCESSYCSAAKVCTAFADVGEACSVDKACRSGRCTEGICEDRVWICQVEDLLDLYQRNPDAM